MNSFIICALLIHHFSMRGIRPTVKLGNTVHKRLPSLLTEIVSPGGFQTTLWSHNLLEELTELTESFCTLHYWLLQGKDIDLNQPREGTHRAEVWGSIKHRASFVFSLWCQDTLLSQHQCVTVLMESNRDAYRALVITFLLRGSFM